VEDAVPVAAEEAAPGEVLQAEVLQAVAEAVEKADKLPETQEL